MAKKCKNCGGKLPFLSSKTLCKACRKQFDLELSDIKNAVLESKKFDKSWVDVLVKHEKDELLTLYGKLYDGFMDDEILDEKEIDALRDFQKGFNFTDEEVKFNERVRFHIYRNYLLKETLCLQ
ncbi:hypothetical protein JXM67_01495 [candidate division WOR-3 bacterium]|nr:hypothetical protein [candidate division WOR-3 bacterium]